MADFIYKLQHYGGSGMSFLDNLPILGQIGLVLSSIGAVTGLLGTDSAADQEKKAVELQSKQEQVEFQQRTLNNINQTSQLIDAQVTTALGRGESPASGSVQSIVKNTYNVGNQSQKNLLDQSATAAAVAKAKEDSLDEQKSGALGQAIGSIGGDFLTAALLA